MAKCYKCGADIDADSLFCDQCGQVQYVCPNCHIVGKGPGKCCGKCGSKLVEATEGESVAQEVVQQDTTSVYSNTVASPTPSVQQPTCLFCRAENIKLPLLDGAVIGRTNGNYVSALSKCIYISGTHARLRKLSDSRWEITDLGSRNGTKINGMPCSPVGTFCMGDLVRIASYYDFIVE